MRRSPASERNPNVGDNVIAVEDKEPWVGCGGDATVLWHDLHSCAQRNQFGIFGFLQWNKDPVFLTQTADDPVFVALWGIYSTMTWQGAELSGQSDDTGVDQLLTWLGLASLWVRGQDVC